MNKKIIIPLILLVCILAGGVIYLYTSLAEQQKQAQNMQELAELDKKGNGKRVSTICQPIW